MWCYGDFLIQYRCSQTQEYLSNSGCYPFRHHFYQDHSGTSSSISFSNNRLSLKLVISKKDCDCGLVPQLQSSEIPTLPTVSQNRRPLKKNCLKNVKNSCFRELPFYLQTMSFGTNPVPKMYKCPLIMWLKINKQRTTEDLQWALLFNFLKIQKWLLGGTFQMYVLKSVFSETTKMSQSLCLFVVAHFRTFLILCQTEFDDVLQECVLHFFSQC